ncbi:MAG: aspartate/glutamate racemase family protein [Candidatus Paceibacterota bacterium]|jgi:glutamate racemase
MLRKNNKISNGKKIGIFDSGLGGLIVAKAIRRAMPQYDYVYLGDTKRVPYGNRSHQAVFEFTKEAVNHLFQKENCAIVIIACNTSSARALKPLQKYFKNQSRRRKGSGPRPKASGKVLGVLIPAAEEAAKFKNVGVLGTAGTVASRAFPEEIQKLNKKTKVFQNSAPMLVPLAEAGEKASALPFIKKYLQPFVGKKIDALVLGCTHYPIYKKEIKKIVGTKVKIISQDEIVPIKLKNYLTRHEEISKKLSRGKTAKILITDETQTIDALTRKWFGNVKPKLIAL